MQSTSHTETWLHPPPVLGQDWCPPLPLCEADVTPEGQPWDLGLGKQEGGWPLAGSLMAISAVVLIADAVLAAVPVLAVDSVAVGAFSLPQVDLALFL